MNTGAPETTPAEWMAAYRPNESEAERRAHNEGRDLLYEAEQAGVVPIRLAVEDLITPPPEVFLLGRMFPLGKASVVFGPQGKGKSALLAQLFFSLAAGADQLWGLRLLGGGCPVLVYSVEDTLDDWTRKGAAILRAGGVDVKRAIDRLWVVDRTEGPVRFTESVTVRSEAVSRREARLTDEVEHVIAVARDRGVMAILVETVSNLVDDEDNSTFAAFQGALRHIAVATGAAVIASHHATKAASKDNDSAIESARGGGSLIANARNAVSLFPADRSQADPLRDRFPAEDLFVLTHGKATSSTRAQAPLVLVRCDAKWGAVFRTPEEITLTPEQECENEVRMQKAREREREQLGHLFDVVARALPARPSLSPSWLRDNCAREIGLAKHRVESLVNVALDRGVLTVHSRSERGITLALGIDPRMPISEATSDGTISGESTGTEPYLPPHESARKPARP